MPGRLRIAALVMALGAAAAVPPAASANRLAVPVSAPAAGQVDVTTFSVTAAGGKAPASVKVKVSVPAALRSRTIVLVTRRRTAKALLVTIMAAGRSGAKTAVAAAGIEVTIDGRRTHIRRRKLRRARNALNAMTAQQRASLCTDAQAQQQLAEAVGTSTASGRALVAAILHVACGGGTDEDRKVLEDAGLTLPPKPAVTPAPAPNPTPEPAPNPVPAPKPTSSFTCRAYSSDPYNYEGVCMLHSETAFNRARLKLSSGTIASQCFAGANPCQVENPGQPNNSVLFTFPSPVTDSGDLNVRSSNAYYNAFGTITPQFSSDGGQTFTDGPPFTPP
jgi:hypothetical protein